MPMRLDEGIAKLIQVGIKFNSIYQILQEEHMGRTTFKHFE
jgi:hypothetical protein